MPAATEQDPVEVVRALGQERLIQYLDSLGSDAQGAGEERLHFLRQVGKLNSQYPGGLAAYVANAKRLLRESKDGVNPFEGYVPAVPEGINLSFPSDEFSRLESAGLKEMARCGVVLVAGGLGERLGYGGIKLELPVDTVTDTCYLEWYIQNLKALSKESGAAQTIPLAIMTSGDTHEKTLALLERNKWFGCTRREVRLMKQEKVPSIDNNDGRFVLCAADGRRGKELETKPHGHGDVHQLMHSEGIAADWLAEGRRWVAFIQDTNAMVFNTLSATVGVSAERSFEVNSICIPRKPKEAIGGIARLESTVPGKPAMTVNVEYNQLDPLLRATARAKGLPEQGDVADPKTGDSPFPGNINTLVFALAPYVENLKRTQGLMPEFVNPKYKDAAKMEFKKPTRLECMMQDYPKILEPSARVGFTSFDRWFGFSPVKNNAADAVGKAKDGLDPNCASSGEADVYYMHGRRLQVAGATLPGDAPKRTDFLDIPVAMWPRVVLAPSFAPTATALRAKLRGAVRVGEQATLVVAGRDVVLEQVDVAPGAALDVSCVDGAQLTVRRCTARNDGVAFAALSAAEQADAAVPEVLRIRGYRTVRKGVREIRADQPGRWVYDDTRPPGSELQREGAGGGGAPPAAGGGAAATPSPLVVAAGLATGALLYKFLGAGGGAERAAAPPAAAGPPAAKL